MLARMRGGKHVAPFKIFTSALGIEHWLQKMAKKQALNIFKVDNLLVEKGFQIVEKQELNGQVRLHYRNSKSLYGETLIVDFHASSGAMNISLNGDQALIEQNFRDEQAFCELLSNTKSFEEFSAVIELACKHAGWAYNLLSSIETAELSDLEAIRSFKLKLKNMQNKKHSLHVGVVNDGEFFVHVQLVDAGS